MEAKQRATVKALAAALLFGAAGPSSKLLLDELSPMTLAGLLYLGAALATDSHRHVPDLHHRHAHG